MSRATKERPTPPLPFPPHFGRPFSSKQRKEKEGRRRPEEEEEQ